MRKFICMLAALLLLTGCGAMKKTPRFVCTATHQEFLENGVVTSTSDYCTLVDDRGLVTGVESYTDGVLQFRSTFEYDEFGNTIRVTEEQDGTTRIADYKNTLDKEGRILRQEIWVGNAMTSFEEYTYDRRGNEIRNHQNYWYEGQEEADWRTYTKTYNWRGDLTWKELHWNFNDEYTVWEYEDGLCIRQTNYETESNTAAECWEYSYDEKGRCIRESRYGKPGELELYHEYIYDDTDRTMTRTCYRADGTVDNLIDVFTYDEHGNEILQERILDGEVYWRIRHTYEQIEVVP